MRIALLGTRGIPARYGGFETFAEELSVRLAARGHDVTVYCRERHREPVYRGVRLRYLPALRQKYTETLAHTFLSSLDLIGRRYDAALYCNAANALFTVVARMAGIPVALNVDGLERRRRKWNAAARYWYHFSEYCATRCPNRMVSDAEEIRTYYRRSYEAESVFIPYGAATGRVATTAALDPLGLEPGRYFLYVTRFEPENNPLLVRQAFERLETPLKLALVGDAPYAADYIRQVRDSSDPRVVIPGAIYGTGYHELQSHCFAYIHATEVGGTHPALIEAMGRGAPTLYLDTPENREVAGAAAIPFTAGTLTNVMARVLAMAPEERAGWGAAAAERVRARYSWDAVTDAYERLLAEIAVREP